MRPTGSAAYSDPSGYVRPSEERIVDGAALDRNLVVKADACVIGTGAGGAPVA